MCHLTIGVFPFNIWCNICNDNSSWIVLSFGSRNERYFGMFNKLNVNYLNYLNYTNYPKNYYELLNHFGEYYLSFD